MLGGLCPVMFWLLPTLSLLGNGLLDLMARAGHGLTTLMQGHRIVCRGFPSELKYFCISCGRAYTDLDLLHALPNKDLSTPVRST